MGWVQPPGDGYVGSTMEVNPPENTSGNISNYQLGATFCKNTLIVCFFCPGPGGTGVRKRSNHARTTMALRVVSQVNQRLHVVGKKRKKVQYLPNECFKPLKTQQTWTTFVFVFLVYFYDLGRKTSARSARVLQPWSPGALEYIIFVYF